MLLRRRRSEYIRPLEEYIRVLGRFRECGMGFGLNACFHKITTTTTTNLPTKETIFRRETIRAVLRSRLRMSNINALYIRIWPFWDIKFEARFRCCCVDVCPNEYFHLVPLSVSDGLDWWCGRTITDTPSSLRNHFHHLLRPPFPPQSTGRSLQFVDFIRSADGYLSIWPPQCNLTTGWLVGWGDFIGDHTMAEPNTYNSTPSTRCRRRRPTGPRSIHPPKRTTRDLNVRALCIYYLWRSGP